MGLPVRVFRAGHGTAKGLEARRFGPWPWA